jgi:maltooligosyltrehalose trehalohydrolase
VHGPSAVVDHGAFARHDDGWQSKALADFIIYELHVGAFTDEGTFAAIAGRLDDLVELGITAIELMPVAQFPGKRNWGYDGAFPFAVQESYGGPAGLKGLADECHRRGIAVVLDVVYNHFGPEGAYAGQFGHYFTEKYHTPWGRAINLDDEYSDEVRSFFIENAAFWFRHYHIDGLRLDAVHALCDLSAKPFLKELGDRVNRLSFEVGRKYYLIAESDLNDVRIINPPEKGGFGLDAQWCDDFHHCLHRLVTGEEGGYYAAFGGIEKFAKAYRDGFVYSWDYSPVRHRRYGSDSADVPGWRFVVCSQNHDQVGNRMLGERLSCLADFETLKLCAAAVLLSPYVPLLFMGEEYGEEAPFLYFIDHGERALIEAVRRGRKEEFAAFAWEGEPPDPYSVETFNFSKLNWHRRKTGSHKVLLEFYKKLIELRKSRRVLIPDKRNMVVEADEENEILAVRRWNEDEQIMFWLNFKQNKAAIRTTVAGKWRKILDSCEGAWEGPGSRIPEMIDGKCELKLGGRQVVVFEKVKGKG